MSHHFRLFGPVINQRYLTPPFLCPLQVVQSLKHLTRFTILSHVRRDHIARLPLPPGQISYLLEKQVYCESLEDFEEAVRDRPALQFSPQPPK